MSQPNNIIYYGKINFWYNSEAILPLLSVIHKCKLASSPGPFPAFNITCCCIKDLGMGLGMGLRMGLGIRLVINKNMKEGERVHV